MESQYSSDKAPASGRELARARRAAQAAHGKAGLRQMADGAQRPSGPGAARAQEPQAASAPAQAAPVNSAGNEAARPHAAPSVQGSPDLPDGRLRSMQHRRARVHGKRAFGSVPAGAVPGVAASGASAQEGSGKSGRELSKAHRRARAEGRHVLKAWVQGESSPSTAGSQPAPEARAGQTDGTRALSRHAGMPGGARPEKFETSHTDHGQRVTGVRIGRGKQVTGDERGACQNISGTGYVTAEQYERFCTTRSPESYVKVGASSTQGGQYVTGTQVRSSIAVTGDESNSGIAITGESDQRLEDDLIGTRASDQDHRRRINTMGARHSVSGLGKNIARSAEGGGWRRRDDDARNHAELTLGGQTVTGSTVGRSRHVTGNEPGSCRTLTGSQYLMPADAEPECGGRPARTNQPRKVAGARTWAGRAVSGVRVEQDQRVTGDEAGACEPVSGTPYVGPDQYAAACETDEAAANSARVAPAPSARWHVSGDTPGSHGLTGADRGVGQRLTGTPYQEGGAAQAIGAAQEEGGSPARAWGGFSISSPQRRAQLRAMEAAPEQAPAGRRITGTMARGEGKVTGKVEFDRTTDTRRGSSETAPRVSGEGGMSGPAITGNVWNNNTGITGTEGMSATVRNPTTEGGPRAAFAGARFFGKQAHPSAAESPITGSSGETSTGATVTASGGARS